MEQPASNHHAAFLGFTESRSKWAALATHEHRIYLPNSLISIACNARLFHVCHLPGKHKALFLPNGTDCVGTIMEGEYVLVEVLRCGIVSGIAPAS